MFKYFTAFLTLHIAAFAGIPNVCIAQVVFSDSPFLELLVEAKASQKHVMVDAYTDWCGWCKVMDKETFADSAVGVYMNERFISTKLNMEEGFGIEMAMKHRVSQYPQYLFFDNDGQLLARISGFLKSAPFMAAVEDAIYVQPHLPKGTQATKFDLDYPEFYRKSFLKNQDRTYPTGEEVEAWLGSRQDLSDEASWGVLSRFISGGTYAMRIAQMREVLIEKYGNSEVKDKLASLVFNDVKAAIKDRDEAVLQNALAACDALLGEDAPKYNIRYRMYYFQMTDEWQRYTEAVEQGRSNPQLIDEVALIQAAKTIYSKSHHEPSVIVALRWIEPLVSDDSEVTLMVLNAGLLLKAGRLKDARHFAEKAIAKGDENSTEVMEAQEILQQIP